MMHLSKPKELDNTRLDSNINCRFFFFFLFRAAPVAYGGSQARGLIGATAAGLH